MNEVIREVEKVREARIPRTLATQHPDATKFVRVQEEPEEAVECLVEFGAEEYMVDFEGKLTPYLQPIQVLMELHEAGVRVGEERFVIVRVPSATKENVLRQVQALLGVMEANSELLKEDPDARGIFEVVHPMTSSPEELVETADRISYARRFASRELDVPLKAGNLRIIPLIEEVPELLDIRNILTGYVEGMREIGMDVSYLRVFIGRSDPALSYGHLPAVLACKLAIFEVYELSDELGIPMAPILGGGCLPFRGHIRPGMEDEFVEEYAGTATYTVQSGFRYDHDREKAVASIRRINELAANDPVQLSGDDIEYLVLATAIFVKHYLSVFFRCIGTLNIVADMIPNTRDRLARKGPVGYARDIPEPDRVGARCKDLGDVGRELYRELRRMRVEKLPELPRAIKFTGACYTVGMPPELIGTGRGLAEVEERLGEDALDAVISRLYPMLREDLQFAVEYTFLETAGSVLPSSGVAMVNTDLEYCVEYLNLEPPSDFEYQNLVHTLEPYLRYVVSEGGVEEVNPFVRDLLLEMGRMRGSLG